MTEFEIIAYHVKRNKERFIARLTRNVERHGECLVWTGRKEPHGYCKMNFRDPSTGKIKHLYVHRVFAVLATGKPIPMLHEPDHECCNRACVLHLRVVTRSINIRLQHVRKKEREKLQRPS